MVSSQTEAAAESAVEMRHGDPPVCTVMLAGVCAFLTLVRNAADLAATRRCVSGQQGSCQPYRICVDHGCCIDPFYGFASGPAWAAQDHYLVTRVFIAQAAVSRSLGQCTKQDRALAVGLYASFYYLGGKHGCNCTGVRVGPGRLARMRVSCTAGPSCHFRNCALPLACGCRSDRAL
jgi:hypothetical protein